MKIRLAQELDVPQINGIYDAARKYMCENGNPTQWENGYPSENVIRQDIRNQQSYVMEENDDILGVFVFILGEEPTYQVIEQGEWRRNQPYGTIHRIASSGKAKGITRECFSFCAKQVDYLRIDTHPNNLTMQNAIKKFGFEQCGIIFVRNGERIAYDYIKRA